MNTVARLTLYGAGLVLVFGVTFLAGRTLVPDETVATWTREAEESAAGHDGMEGSGEHDPSMSASSHVSGLAVEQDGYRLGSVDAPETARQPGTLSFRILDADDQPVTGYEVNHEKQLHLILVRSDGADFQHLHPSLDRTTGTWSTPLTWTQGGTYRMYTDFLPAEPGASAVTLGHKLEVAGEFEPVEQRLSRTDSVDGFDVSITGNLTPGVSRELVVRVTRDGQPETHLEPYLGAFGHLVALREGDLAYLHVHADDDHTDGSHAGEEEGGEAHGHDGELAGPEIAFSAEAPTSGRYLLYLDFKVDGVIRTAEFVLEAK